MDFAESVHRFDRGRFHARTVGDIDTDRMHALASPPQMLHRFVQMVLGAIADDDSHARIGKGSGNPKADAAGATGDEGHFSRNVLHRCLHRRTMLWPSAV